MKNMRQFLFLVTLLVICIVPIQIFAQASDTLVVTANGNDLNTVINGDTLANGDPAHHVYKLVTLDKTYKFSGTITVKDHFTIIGEVDPVTGRPPCIQPAVLEDGTIPGTLFNVNTNEVNAVFKNLYFLALATNNTANGGGIAIQVSGDDLRIIIDNCVFDGWQTFAIGYNGQWDDFFITNCNFRNMVHPNQWYIGEVIRNMWPGTAYTDTMSMVGNTMLCVNGYASCPVTKYYTTYFEFLDNKVLYTFKNPLFIFNVTNAKINNNVFYGTYAGGISQAENPWWDNLWHPDTTYGVVSLDSLNIDNAKIFCPADSSNPNILSIAEAARTVEVKNNTYFWPTALTDFWTTWNDTATVTSILTASWMNDRTKAMFADKTTWPGLVESGNVNVDPGYMSSIDTDVLNGTTGNDVGLFEYFRQIRTGTAATDVWGYSMTQVSGDENWVPTWPLPESSSLTDVEEEISASVPSSFTLSEVYPNPFNPSANIEYRLNKAGVTNLFIYNALGQRVMTLVDNVFQTANTYKISFNMSNCTSGIYFVVLQQNGNKSIRKMMLLK